MVAGSVSASVPARVRRLRRARWLVDMAAAVLGVAAGLALFHLAIAGWRLAVVPAQPAPHQECMPAKRGGPDGASGATRPAGQWRPA